jgi:chromosome segregation ATPase
MQLLLYKNKINSLNNERKSYVDKIESYLNKIESYANKRDVLISTTEEYFQISEGNINEANNPNNLNTILLLESINNQRQNASSDLADVSIDLADVSVDLADTSIELAEIESKISEEKMKLRSYSELNKAKHFFIWVVEPNLGDIARKVSFSLWLALSFLLSFALYFLATVMISTKKN